MHRGAVWMLLLVAVVVSHGPGTARAQEETAWDRLVRENPLVAEEGATPRLERQILQRLTPDEAERLIAGGDPEPILLTDGRDLASALAEMLNGPGGVYFPVDSCKLTGAGVPAGDLYPSGDTVITARGTCDIPPEAIGLVVNIKVPNPSESGRMSLFPADGGVFNPGYVNFAPGTIWNNGVLVELCAGACASGDLVVRMINVSTPQPVVFHATGYFAPEGDPDPLNELNAWVSLVGTELQVTDAGGTLGAELSGFATDAELAAHAGSTMNPHGVTMEQVSPTSTEGDLLVDDGTSVTRLPAGADGQILTADSALPEGLGWASPSPRPCPSAGAPWTAVDARFCIQTPATPIPRSYHEAVDACAAMDATLCTLNDWETACRTGALPDLPDEEWLIKETSAIWVFGFVGGPAIWRLDTGTNCYPGSDWIIAGRPMTGTLSGGGRCCFYR